MNVTVVWAQVLLLLLLPFGAANVGHCESAEVIERHVKAAFIYQFTKHFEWPAKSTPFTIAVIEDDEFLSVLTDTAAGKNVGSRSIVVKASSWIDATVDPPEIIVLPKNKSALFDGLFKKLKSAPSLIVTHSEGLAAAGATINFYFIDQKLKFELNQISLKDKNIKISDSLLKLAKLVN